MNTNEETNISVAFGSFIRAEREKKGFLQEDIARKVGIARSSYAMIEIGQRKAFLPLAIEICDTLDVDIGVFAKQLKNKKT